MTRSLAHGFHRTPETARRVPSAGGHLLAGVEDTAGHFTLIRSATPPGDRTPLHRHLHMDESFYVLSGSYTVTCGDDEFTVGPGEFVHLPHGVAHKYVAGSEGGEMLILGHPAGLEQFFDDWDAGESDIRELGRRHGIEFIE